VSSSLNKISCSGASIFTLQNETIVPARRNTAMGTSFRVVADRGVDAIKPPRTDKKRITSCLGLTQTTLRGMPLLDQRVVSLNQRIRTTRKETVVRFNERTERSEAY
jgi:hypothetical protein